ncbi:MAG: hypothetical protein NC922_06980 [Candidatus Omnitrophica bacterium]|nr:hypothetical protein [Candidatus Omnitrophota bacterium]
MIEILKNLKNKITGIGSLPFIDLKESIEFIKNNFKDIPFLPQLPRLNFKEEMNIQVIEKMPGIELKERKINFSYSEEEILNVYQKITENDVEYFKISREYGIGMYELLNTKIEGMFLKGQLAGPVTFLSAVKDEEGKPLIFNEMLEDIFIKILGMKGLWIAKQIEERGKIPVIFYDEPVMASFGSAFFPIDKNRVKNILMELIKFLRDRDKNILLGIHCCGNTDWSIFLDLDIDILSFDAFNYLDKFFIYWEDIEKFLNSGKIIAWGIIPSTDEIEYINLEQIKDKLNIIYTNFKDKGYDFEKIKKQFLFTPSCGMSWIKEKNAYKIVEFLNFVGIYR